LQSKASSHVYHHLKAFFWQASLALNINLILVMYSVHLQKEVITFTLQNER